MTFDWGVLLTMRLNCILQDLFRDTPLDHIWHAQIRAQFRPNTPNTVFGVRIWARQIFLRVVSIIIIIIIIVYCCVFWDTL